MNIIGERLNMTSDMVLSGRDPWTKAWTSSAKRLSVAEWLGKRDGMSVVYKMNRVGPRTDP